MGMRRQLFSFLFFVGALIGSGAGAQDRSSGQHAAIIGVIGEQLAAFRRDDGPAAFAFASPKIQQMFGNPDRFMGMVRESYPPVYRPREVEFLALSNETGRLVQRVRLVGPSGEPVIARYFMTRMPDGSWRIDGCVLERTPGQNV